VTLISTAGAFTATTVPVTSGAFSATLLAPGTAQTVTIAATSSAAGAAVATTNVAIGGGAAPTQQTVTATTTGTYCFAYSGPTTAVANFGTLFTSAVTGVNILQLPAGNYMSWFAAAPTLATATSLTSGQIVCVAAAVGSNVFN